MLTIILFIIAAVIIIGLIGLILSFILGTGALIGYTIYNIIYIIWKNLLLSILILLPSILMISHLNFLGLIGVLLYIVIIKARSKISLQKSIEKYINKQLCTHRYISIRSIKSQFIDKYDENIYWLYLKLVNSVYIEALNNALENKKSNDIVYLEKPLDIYIDKNFYTKLQDGIFQKVDDLISEVLKTKVYISADTLKEKTVVSVAGEIPLQSINTDLDLFTLINKLYDENLTNIVNVVNKYDNIIVLNMNKIDYYISLDYKEILRNNFEKYCERVIETKIRKYGVMINDLNDFNKYTNLANEFDLSELTLNLYFNIYKSSDSGIKEILSNHNIVVLGKFFVDIEVVKQNFNSFMSNEFGSPKNRDFITLSEIAIKFGLDNSDCYQFLINLKNYTDILASWELLDNTSEYIINKCNISKYTCIQCGAIDINCYHYESNIYCDKCFNKIREEEQGEKGRKTVKQISESEVPPHLLARFKAKEVNVK